MIQALYFQFMTRHPLLLVLLLIGGAAYAQEFPINGKHYELDSIREYGPLGYEFSKVYYYDDQGYRKQEVINYADGSRSLTEWTRDLFGRAEVVDQGVGSPDYRKIKISWDDQDSILTWSDVPDWVADPIGTRYEINRDDRGNPVAYIEYYASNPTPEFFILRQFDERGNLIRRSWVNALYPTLPRFERFSYDEEDRLDYVDLFSGDSTLLRRLLYSYDEQGRKLSLTSDDSGGIQWQFSYNDSGHVKVTTYEENPLFRSTRIFRDQETININEDWDGEAWELISKRHTIRNDFDSLSQIRSYQWIDGEWQLQTKRDYFWKEVLPDSEADHCLNICRFQTIGDRVYFDCGQESVEYQPLAARLTGVDGRAWTSLKTKRDHDFVVSPREGVAVITVRARNNYCLGQQKVYLKP